MSLISVTHNYVCMHVSISYYYYVTESLTAPETLTIPETLATPETLETSESLKTPEIKHYKH